MLVKRPSATIVNEPDIFRQMEYAGRVCTNTLHRMAENKALDFVTKRAQAKEFSVLEHAGIDVTNEMPKLDLLDEDSPEFGLVMSRAVLGGIRCSDLAQYSSHHRDPSTWADLPRDHTILTFDITCSRATAQQLERHRNLSFCERSLRYVKLSKDTFEMCTADPESNSNNRSFMKAAETALDCYLELLDSGYSADDARKVLPLGTATRVVVTAQWSWWLDVLSKRYHKRASREMILLMQALYKLMPEQIAHVVGNNLQKQFDEADRYV